MIDTRMFHPDAVTAETRALNEGIIKLMEQVPNWWEIGAQQMRDLRASGRGPFPLVPNCPRARVIEVPGLAGPVPVRIIEPEGRPARGVYLHMHGGGFVLGGADQQDLLLERIANETGQVVASVEYRLAPEHPFPAGPDDCFATAEWLIANAMQTFGTDALTIGGESAGANLAAVTLLRCRDRLGYTGWKGANLVFGIFDHVMTPSQHQFGNVRLILRTLDIEKFAEAYVPAGWDNEDPDLSPLRGALHDMPPALFTIGTADALLDDSLFMHARWLAAGNHGELEIYPGGAHGFVAFPGTQPEQARARCITFLNGVLG